STRLAASQVRVETGEAEGLVQADEALLYRAVVNLVMNALQAPGRSEPVCVRVACEAGEGVRIDVEDTGDGVPGDLEEKIFDPFFTTRATGTGLGLSLARRAAEAHGGTLTLRSREGRGACFRLSLPLAGEAQA